MRGDHQGAAARRREGSPLPVADLPTQALTEASLVPFHGQLSHCCSPSLPDNETPDWIGSEGLISASEDGFFRRHTQTLAQGHGCCVWKAVSSDHIPLEKTGILAPAAPLSWCRAEPGPLWCVQVQRQLVKNLGISPP